MEIKTLKASQKTKKTAIGEIPVDWSVANLGRYIKEVSQRSNESGSSILVLSVTNTQGFVSSEKYFDKQVFSKDLSNYKVIHKNQFAYNPSRINVGSIARLKTYNKGLLSPMYVVFEATKELECNFLEYWISSQYFRNMVNANTQGTVRNSVNFSTLAEFLLRYPPLSEQKKIAEILSSVDAVIENTRVVIDQTKTVKKGLMQELLTRGIPGRHKRFKKTELGMIPEEWKIQPVKELISVCQYGLNKPLLSEPVGTPILRMNNLSNGEINIDNLKYATLTKEEEQKYILEQGDLLFNRTNSRDLVGKVALYRLGMKMAFASYLLRLKVNHEKSDPIWLNYCFNTIEIQDKLSCLATPGVSQSNINARVMQSLKLRTPSLREQKEISKLLESVNKQIKQESVILEKLSAIKSALMQVLLTGEVRVKV
jgi:type I restriction enzyme S subunit